MKDEHGNKITEKELMQAALDHVAEALCLLYETETDTGHAAAFMCDSLVKYLQVVYRDHNVLSASADYTKYENLCYKRFMKAKSKRTINHE